MTRFNFLRPISDDPVVVQTQLTSARFAFANLLISFIYFYGYTQTGAWQFLALVMTAMTLAFLQVFVHRLIQQRRIHEAFYLYFGTLLVSFLALSVFLADIATISSLIVLMVTVFLS